MHISIVKSGHRKAWPASLVLLEHPNLAVTPAASALRPRHSLFPPTLQLVFSSWKTLLHRYLQGVCQQSKIGWLGIRPDLTTTPELEHTPRG